ncbi:MAG: hypothetical protein HC802_00275 [Caldilineaceae bacterium]|nr:hypothetical protein [Caldilineaceae bacterium]
MQDTDQPERESTASPYAAAQPWLSVDYTEAAEGDLLTNDAAVEESAVGKSGAPGQDRLVIGVQGLLRPIAILNRLPQSATPDREPQPDEPRTAAPSSPTADELRRLRQTLNAEPSIAAFDLAPLSGRLPPLRIAWVFWLIGLAIATPILLSFNRPMGRATEWPGVAEAYIAIDNLSINADVLVYWAYDPATSGEMDLVALPIVRHLIDRRCRLIVVSPLPNGPAVARRLFTRAVADAQTSSVGSPGAGQSLFIDGGYLPGGASVLPLVGQDLPAALSPEARANYIGPPDLAIVLGAQAEDVQAWLEQVQPLNLLPVVAVVSAGADPMARPYLDSGQLRGLVSGFDGAASYWRLSGEALSPPEDALMRGQLVYQNWGAFALLLVLLLGNLAALSTRRSDP